MKREIRTRMRRLLREIAAAERQRLSLEVCRRMLGLPEWQRAETVMLFLATPTEVDTAPLVEAGWRAGKRVLAPRVDPERNVMAAFEIRAWSDCLPGFKGILEPVEQEAFDVPAIDLIVVPGLAFDLGGGRLGAGGGFYDRFLARDDCRAGTVGVAFELQVVEALPREPHDRGVESLVTDRAVRRFGADGERGDRRSPALDRH